MKMDEKELTVLKKLSTAKTTARKYFNKIIVICLVLLTIFSVSNPAFANTPNNYYQGSKVNADIFQEQATPTSAPTLEESPTSEPVEPTATTTDVPATATPEQPTPTIPDTPELPTITSTIPVEMPTSTITNTAEPPTVTTTPTLVAPSPTKTFTTTPTEEISSQGGVQYYVSTTGSDSNPGTQSQPWKTIQKAANTLASGDTVTVLAGNYPAEISVSKSNLTFVAQGTVVTKAWTISGNNNVVNGFEITDTSSNYGVMVGHWESTTASGNLIENNNIHNTMQDGIWFFGSNNTYSGNYIHDMADGNVTHVDCFQTWGPASGAIFEGNTCHNPNTSGVNQMAMVEGQYLPVENLMFRNNIFIMHCPSGPCAMNFWGADIPNAITNISVVNNTFVHIGSSVGDDVAEFAYINGGEFKNNLVINYGLQNVHQYVSLYSSEGVVVSNNAVWTADGVPPSGVPYPGDIWMQDPKLVNLTGLDFHLLSTSPLINKGSNLGSENTNDLDDNPRPVGSGYDIGAFELQSQQATATVSSPTKTNTPVPPTATRTNTPIKPTATKTNAPVTPTATRTNTPITPTATKTNTPVTPTATRTNTPVTPTATKTNTPVGPTATRTNTPVTPTATNTNSPVTPTATTTNTTVTPTATNTSTPVVPTATGTNPPVTPTATNTNTPVTPTATKTNTPVTPTATATPTSTPLSQPNLIAPVNYGTTLTTLPTFEWGTVSGATSYTFQLATSSTFSSLISNLKVTTPNYTITSGLARLKTYYWRVMANGNKSSAWSQIFRFTSANPPAIPVLAKPIDGSLLTNYQPRLDWHGSADTFQVQLASSSSFSDSSILMTVDVTVGTHYDIPAPLTANKTYYWRVKAIDAVGQYSLWSPYLSFKTAMLPPTLVDPLNTGAALTTRPDFDWGAVSGATGYKAQISKYSTFSSMIIDTSVTKPLYTPTTDLPNNILIYWRVSATGSKPSAWSKVFSFTSADPPPVPALVNPAVNSLVIIPPANNYTASSSISTHAWKKVTGADHYQLQVAVNRTFPPASIVNDVTTADSSYPISNSLAPNTTFFWRVRSFDEVRQYSSWSTVNYYRTSMTPPVLASPENNGQALSTRPTFDWGDVRGATGYGVQVSTGSSFSSILLNTTVTASTYTPASDLPRNIILYWRVSAKGNNPSAWSAVYEFTSANPPSIPVLASPSSNSLVSGYTPTLDWIDTLGADNYRIQVATSSSFSTSSLVDDKNVNISAFTVPETLAANTTYYWRVSSYAVNGQHSLWSTYLTFRTAMLPPTLLAPALNGSITTVRPSFDWNEVTGASGYVIQVSTAQDFSKNLISTSTTKSTYNATINLPNGVIIYWRVYAKGTNPSTWVKSNFTIQ
jgi:hypothetical protein